MSKSKIIPFKSKSATLTRYRLITPAGTFVISSDVPFAAMMSTFLLGGGFFGLKSEKENETIMLPFHTVEEVLDISSKEVKELINKHKSEIYNCLRSIENPDNITEFNLKERADAFADKMQISLHNDDLI